MVTVGAIDDVYVCDVKIVLVLVLAILFTSIVNNPGCQYVLFQLYKLSHITFPIHVYTIFTAAFQVVCTSCWSGKGL